LEDAQETGMAIDSTVKADIVCEPCLAGKMHSNKGYRYWITFIDDATSHHAAMQLKRKSDAFDAFRT